MGEGDQEARNTVTQRRSFQGRGEAGVNETEWLNKVSKFYDRVNTHIRRVLVGESKGPPPPRTTRPVEARAGNSAVDVEICAAEIRQPRPNYSNFFDRGN